MAKCSHFGGIMSDPRYRPIYDPDQNLWVARNVQDYELEQKHKDIYNLYVSSYKHMPSSSVF